MPRKGSGAGATSPTRRSTRISSQSAAADSSTTAAATTKKRPAAETTSSDAVATEEGASAKKVKSSDDGAAEGEAATNPENEEPLPELQSIDIGDVLPSLALKNEKGEDIEISGLATEKGVVFFLVPKADTAGCTAQACGYRDVYPDFTSSNFDVYCLSADSISAQSKWQAKQELPYPLISDPKRILITALGAGEGGKTTRSHFIFEKGGKLIDKKIPVKALESPTLALEFIKGRL